MSQRDKAWQGVVANKLNSFRNGAVGFIDWLDGSFGIHQAMGAVGASAEALAGERSSGLV